MDVPLYSSCNECSAGKHTVRFVFDPKSLHVTGNCYTFVALGIMAVVAVITVVLQLHVKRKE